jgi:hypothetical protein
MGLQNKIETALNIPVVDGVGVEVSDFESTGMITSFMLNTADTAEVAYAADMLDRVVRGQRIMIERFDRLNNFAGYSPSGCTVFSIENPTITVSEVTGYATDPFKQKFLDGENEFIEINVHELDPSTQTLNVLASWIGLEENGIIYEGTC